MCEASVQRRLLRCSSDCEHFMEKTTTDRCPLHVRLQSDRLSDLCIPGGEDGLEERIIDKVNGQPVPHYLIYDIIKLNGRPV
ncbi:unnamed protein product [Oncorhynchus mykiss]|uniref:Uncharacterized protein n=1 Tax=Oncorhynchus mykiss TaxID=8022 RepID=A0A060WSL8_ONCMY|nr:unnamed protein product [Oncorhynchus mykiss]